MYINIDMDGVVADFNGFASKILNRQISWEGRDITSREWDILRNIPRLYYQLPLIEEGKEIVFLATKYTTKVRFLTAIPNSIPSAEHDKRQWLQKYFPGIPMVVGPRSKDKQFWANTGDVLIDDKRSNVVEWEQRKGIAIHHTGNYNTTINTLSQLLADIK